MPFSWHNCLSGIFLAKTVDWRSQMCHYDVENLINYLKYATKTTIHTYLFSTISVMWVQKSATDPLFVCTDFPVNSFLSYKHNFRKDVCMTQKSVQTKRSSIWTDRPIILCVGIASPNLKRNPLTSNVVDCHTTLEVVLDQSIQYGSILELI